MPVSTFLMIVVRPGSCKPCSVFSVRELGTRTKRAQPTASIRVTEILGRFRKHNATPNRDVTRHHWPRRAEPRMLPEAILERKIALKALRSKALRLGRQKTTILRREGQALATFRLTGSRAQAIPRHVTSRFGVALCFLNLPNVRASEPTIRLQMTASVCERTWLNLAGRSQQMSYFYQQSTSQLNA